MFFLPATTLLVRAAALVTADSAAQVAAMHTIFNLVSSLAVVPFARGFASLITMLVPGPGGGI